MRTYRVYMKAVQGDFARLLAAPPNYSANDQLLIMERPLYDAANSGQEIGHVIARLTVMNRTPASVPLVLGNADHHLTKGRHTGMVCAQGSWRFSDRNRVFAIIGGTDDFRAARGTVTFEKVDAAIEKITYEWT